MSSSYQLHSWFTYSMLLLFLSTAGFWVMLMGELLFSFSMVLWIILSHKVLVVALFLLGSLSTSPIFADD